MTNHSLQRYKHRKSCKEKDMPEFFRFDFYASRHNDEKNELVVLRVDIDQNDFFSGIWTAFSEITKEYEIHSIR